MSNLILVKPEKLDKIQKPIDEAKYFQWKETVLDCASQKADWAEFAGPTVTWIARNEDPHRGIEDAVRRSHLNSYITYIATFAPNSLVHDIINESTGNGYIDSRIRSMYQLRSSGASAFRYFRKTRSFNHAGSQSYQDFYYELRASKYETLMKAGQNITFQGRNVTVDEVLTPSMQNSIVVDWLAGIDEDLVDEVEQYYARDLENVSLVDMQKTIAQGLPALLAKIKTKKDIGAYKVKLEEQASVGVAKFNKTYNSNRGGGRGFNRQTRQASRQSFQRQEPCSLCKAYGYTPLANTHTTKDCSIFKAIQKRDKNFSAMQVTSCHETSDIEEINNELKDTHLDIPWLDGHESD